MDTRYMSALYLTFVNNISNKSLEYILHLLTIFKILSFLFLFNNLVTLITFNAWHCVTNIIITNARKIKFNNNKEKKYYIDPRIFLANEIWKQKSIISSFRETWLQL